MALYIASLNSGSNGNCYYIGNGPEAVLVDAGLSCRETEVRMRRLGISLKKVKALFISHEHSDHIYGAASISRKYQIPVFVTPATCAEGRLKLKSHLQFSFAALEPVQVGSLSITPVPTAHDAIDPHSFVVAAKDLKVGVFTDIGVACEQVIRHFKQCHAAFLESNYDEHLLEYGRYSLPLKNRIRGGKGHLSNRQALELFLAHRPSFMSHLILSHLSAENNRQKMVQQLFQLVAGDTSIIVASRNKETRLFRISNEEGLNQLSLF
jgi:phosphoribosyl 1,2-cyclic phosphodiesterase